MQMIIVILTFMLANARRNQVPMLEADGTKRKLGFLVEQDESGHHFVQTIKPGSVLERETGTLSTFPSHPHCGACAARVVRLA